MGQSLNCVTLIGNAGGDPEIRTTQGGMKVASFALATNESWNDRRSGEKIERTEWHRIVVFNEVLVALVEKYVAKGDKLFLQGMLKTRKWQDQSGADRYNTEIVLGAFDSRIILLGSANANGRNGGSDRGRPSSDAQAGDGYLPRGGPDLDDEIPFAPCRD